MLFKVSSRARPEATREQLIEHLTRRLDPATWDLIRQGVVSHVLYKVGDEPGFIAPEGNPVFEPNPRHHRQVQGGPDAALGTCPFARAAVSGAAL
jgi:hypothetical protein